MNFLTDDPLYVISKLTDDKFLVPEVPGFVTPMCPPATPRSFYDNVEKHMRLHAEEMTRFVDIKRGVKRLEWTDPYVWDREYDVERI